MFFSKLENIKLFLMKNLLIYYLNINELLRLRIFFVVLSLF
jgi:hypothetical protein